MYNLIYILLFLNLIINMEKYLIQVFYNSDETTFSLSKNSTILKLLQFIEISFDELKNSSYQLIFKQINLKSMPSDEKLLNIFEDDALQNENKILLNILSSPNGNNSNNEINYYLNISCLYKNKKSYFKISPLLNFQKFKFNILSLFPDLDQENYQIIYNNEDITNYYSNEKSLKEIFNLTNDNNNGTFKTIEIQLTSKPKIIIEYYKRCSFCYEIKANYICKKCAIASCNNCCNKDKHFKTKDINFELVINFKTFENKILNEFLEKLKEYDKINEQLNSDNILKIKDEKFNLLNNKFEEIINLVNQIKNYQNSNLMELFNFILNTYEPYNFSIKISELIKLITNYLNNPFYDCEESMKKIIEFEKMLNNLFNNINEFKNYLNDFYDKFNKCINIDNKIIEFLKKSYLDTKNVFNDKSLHKKYIKIMKILDSSRVIVFDNNNNKSNFENENKKKEKNKNGENIIIEEDDTNYIENNNDSFTIMNFLDEDYNFKDNFNNFVQVNYNQDNFEKIFVITGSTTQKFFVYDLGNNEMEFINNLKYSHNWWPSLLPIKTKNDQLILFCLSGSYTNRCEMLILSKEKEKIDDIKNNIKNEEEKIPDVIENKDGISGIENVQKHLLDSIENPSLNKNNENGKIEENEKNKNKKTKFQLNWQEISSTNANHGQATSMLYNQQYIFLFFGYNYKIEPITLIERLDIQDISSIIIQGESGSAQKKWETLQFQNPNNISSILYYNSLLKLDDKHIFILGGLKEIDQIDNIYQYKIETNELVKNEKIIKFKNINFLNEKNLIKINNDNINKENGKKDKKIFAIFDGKNNVHLVTENFDYKLIVYNP